MEPYVIGIDIGTGSSKGIALNYNGEVIASSQVSYPTLHPKPGYQEQAPELIWQAFLKSVSRITAQMKGSPAALSLSSAMHSVIPVDKNCHALMNMMIWADNRSASVATKIRASSPAEMLYEQTGTPIHAMSPLCKIQWLSMNEPDVFKNAFKFISIKEYVWYKLFQRFEADYSIASATGLMDIEKLIWSQNALDLILLKKEQLSNLVSPEFQAICNNGELCKQMGLANGTPFFIGASDGCLANIGSFVTEGVMALTIGTSGAVRITRKTPMLNFKAMIFNYRLSDTEFVCGGPTNNGGVALKWFAQTFLGNKLDTPEAYALVFDTLAKSKPGAEGLIFLPYILGERAPIWNSEACGVFFGIRQFHNQTHFIRAVIEGISMALYHIAQSMKDDRVPVREIHVSGGFVHSMPWLQIIANIFDKKMVLINAEDASAIGAGYLALKTMGLIRNYEQLKPEKITEILPQQEDAAVYPVLFERYRNLYESIRSEMTEDHFPGQSIN